MRHFIKSKIVFVSLNSQIHRRTHSLFDLRNTITNMALPPLLTNYVPIPGTFTLLSSNCSFLRSRHPCQIIYFDIPIRPSLTVAVLTDSYKTTHYLQYPEAKKFVAVSPLFCMYQHHPSMPSFPSEINTKNCSSLHPTPPHRNNSMENSVVDTTTTKKTLALCGMAYATF